MDINNISTHKGMVLVLELDSIKTRCLRMRRQTKDLCKYKDKRRIYANTKPNERFLQIQRQTKELCKYKGKQRNYTKPKTNKYKEKQRIYEGFMQI